MGLRSVPSHPVPSHPVPPPRPWLHTSSRAPSQEQLGSQNGHPRGEKMRQKPKRASVDTQPRVVSSLWKLLLGTGPCSPNGVKILLTRRQVHYLKANRILCGVQYDLHLKRRLKRIIYIPRLTKRTSKQTPLIEDKLVSNPIQLFFSSS